METLKASISYRLQRLSEASLPNDLIVQLTSPAAARPDAAGLALLRDAADAMRLSARGYHRVLRVARTLG
jgi:magnesium chelatase family protein